MANEIAHGTIKARAAEIFANIQKTMKGANDPAKDLTLQEVELLLIHSYRDKGIEVKFSRTPAEVDLNFANGKDDLSSTQVLPRGFGVAHGGASN